MHRNPTFGVTLGIVLLLIWVVIGTLGFMGLEGWTFVDSLYMTVITLSTVGFQEVHELSRDGRLFASFMIVVGIGTAVYTFSRVGQVILEGEMLTILGRQKVRSAMKNLEGHWIVCGYGRIGRPVADGLRGEGVPFCVIDRNVSLEPDLLERKVLFVPGEATDEEVLKTAGVERATGLLALLPSKADNLYLTISAKSMNSNLSVIARALDSQAEITLKKSGADRVVSPDQIAATRVLNAALSPTVVELLDLVTHRQHLQLSLEEVKVAEGSRLAGQSLVEAEIRSRCGVIVIAIKRASGEMTFNPDASEKLRVGDLLVSMGKREDLKGLEQLCRGKGGDPTNDTLSSG